MTWLERVRIEKLTDAGYRQARILGRSPATISREMRRRETIVRPRPTGQGGAEAARRRDCCHRFAEVVNRRARLAGRTSLEAAAPARAHSPTKSWRR
ncbi:helix-turn-helix domain-containing protein [Nocardia farcinica]|uniref:Helix-turn-helix domain-containing protein n=1 Tax=Gordonia rubripertincta TaxID=36822 RepID=A0AAW4GB49_GORRU|nr:helix-turn-helix domain-containing protein [Nocardia farcinica]MBM7280594.1 helix-turn-helix domain-containing protein [Gordonia rubripertincta]MBR7193752.1 helix-turn-helix domain-containing protein [Gordonia sp. SCSIO 19800]MBF6434529.1 helix-turn-helix domain-containing protein [Nocardia farcinica]MBF6505610.1 helix-turn-helix domain-containing protein [Nocardia farcinica]